MSFKNQLVYSRDQLLKGNPRNALYPLRTVKELQEGRIGELIHGLWAEDGYGVSIGDVQYLLQVIDEGIKGGFIHV